VIDAPRAIGDSALLPVLAKAATTAARITLRDAFISSLPVVRYF